MVSGRRRSFEAGHRPKFMVVVDSSPESSRAVHFAARRSARTGASLLMLGVVEPPETFEWLGVGDAMMEEAAEELEKLLEAAANHARACSGVEPERAVREGKLSDVILELIGQDQDVSFLVLAAATEGAGPGPLVSDITSGSAARFPIPVVIVPGDLTDDEIDALAG